jgi:arsenite methyltransferase
MNDAAELFDDWARRGRDQGMEDGHFPRAEAILQALAPQPGERVLDLGCGNGWALEWLARRIGPEGMALGIDLAPTMIAHARARESAGPKEQPSRTPLEFLRASFEALPLAESSRDLIFSMEALYYAEDLDAVLKECRRVLAPGGRLGIGMDFYRENEDCHSWPEELGLSMQLLSASEWEMRLRAAGFEITRSFRSLDPRPLPADAPAALRTFRKEVGSLAIIARRP